eukprot:3679531-Rhodomonas_salina.1
MQAAHEGHTLTCIELIRIGTCIGLRDCYAVPGTGLAEGAIGLCAGYAVPSIERVHAAVPAGTQCEIKCGKRCSSYNSRSFCTEWRCAGFDFGVQEPRSTTQTESALRPCTA